MRGSSKPVGIPWARPLSISLAPLPPAVALALFRNISGCDKDDPYAKKLVEAMETFPLVVGLLANQANGKCGTTEQLWLRWEKQRTSAISRLHSSNCHLDLNASIELTLSGLCTRSSPMARHTLALLSLLPNGLDENGEIFKELRKLEELKGLLDSLRLLCDTALVSLDLSLTGRRYRVLDPMVRYARKYLLPFLPISIQQHLIHVYIQFMKYNCPFTPENHQTAPVELNNSHSVLQFALDFKPVDMSVIVEGFLSHTKWMTWCGEPSERFLALAVQDGTLNVRIRGDCHQALGEVYKLQNRLEKAEESFKKAIILHMYAHQVTSEGDDRKLLAELYLHQERLAEAETYLLDAFMLHEMEADVIGQGNDKARLGELYIRQKQLDKAESCLLDAVKLHQQAQDILGEGTDMMRLGQLYLEQKQFNKAVESLLDALHFHQQAHSASDQGSDRLILGKLYMQQNRLKEAEVSLLDALKLHHRLNEVADEGHDSLTLGRLYLLQGRLDEAEKFLQDAVKLHQQAHAVLDEGTDMIELGQVYLQRDRLDDAETSILEGVKLHRQVDFQSTEAYDNYWLKELYQRKGRLEQARKSCTRGRLAISGFF